MKPITFTYIGLCKQNPNMCKVSIGIFGALVSLLITPEKNPIPGK